MDTYVTLFVLRKVADNTVVAAFKDKDEAEAYRKELWAVDVDTTIAEKAVTIGNWG